MLCDLFTILLEEKAMLHNWPMGPTKPSTLDFQSKLYEELPEGVIQKRVKGHRCFTGRLLTDTLSSYSCQALERSYVSKELLAKIRNGRQQKGTTTVS